MAASLVLVESLTLCNGAPSLPGGSVGHRKKLARFKHPNIFFYKRTRMFQLFCQGQYRHIGLKEL